MIAPSGLPGGVRPRTRDLLRLGSGPLELPAGTPGDPGLFGPGSAVWRIGREKALLAAGPAALLLQVAHPLVAAGVVRHSGFRQDPFRRLWSTLDAVLTICFGDRLQAHAAASRVSEIHRTVRGRISEEVGPFAAGTRYEASDPRLALWVHATLVHTALEAYSRFVRPATHGQRSRYYEEMKTYAQLFGVPRAIMPKRYADFQVYFRCMLQGPQLIVGGDARSLAPDILAPPLPAALHSAGSLMRLLTAGLLPERLRSDFRLSWGARDRAAFLTLSRALRGGVAIAPPAIRYWTHYRVAQRRLAAVPGT